MSTVTLTTVRNKARYRIELEINVKPLRRVSPELTIDLEPAAADACELSICAGIYRDGREDSFGQCREYVLELLAKHPDVATVLRLCELWERWHLNGMQAGTRAQREALKDMSPAVYPESHFDKACAHLEARGILKDRGYSYGSAWLSEPLPDEVKAEILSLASQLAKAA